MPLKKKNSGKYERTFLRLSTGTPSPNYAPPGAGRNGALNAAKRRLKIPRCTQPKAVRPGGREYDYGDGNVIREDPPHIFPDDPSQDRGPHFNDPNGDHYDFSIPGCGCVIN